MTFLLPLAFLLIPAVAAVAPRGMAALLDMLGIVCALQLFLQRAQIDWAAMWRQLRWIIVALAFIALSACWSVSPRALEMLRDTMLVSVAALFTFTASRIWPQPLVDRALRWFLLAALLAFTLFAIHAALGYPLNLWYSRTSLEGLLGTNIPKRTAALFALLMWPAALLVLRSSRSERRMDAAPIMLLVFSTIVLVMLPSRAAMLGAILGLATYGLARFNLRAARAVGLVALPLAIPLMLAVALCLPRLPHDWQQQLPLSGEIRLEIWNYAANKALLHLPLGIGIDGSRTLAPMEDKIQTGATATSLLPDHPHNVFLQIWLEGGLIGAALAIGLTALLWVRLRRLPARLQPFIWGYTVTATVTLAIAYGTWQAWWLAGHGLAAILLALACRAGEARPDGNRQDDMATQATG